MDRGVPLLALLSAHRSDGAETIGRARFVRPLAGRPSRRADCSMRAHEAAQRRLRSSPHGAADGVIVGLEGFESSWSREPWPVFHRARPGARTPT